MLSRIFAQGQGLTRIARPRTWDQGQGLRIKAMAKKNSKLKPRISKSHYHSDSY